MFQRRTHAIVTDLDGCLVNIYQELQKHLWDLYSVWVPVEAITEYRVDGPIWKYILEHRPDSIFVAEGAMKVPTQPELGKILATFWSEPKWYVTAKPYLAYWQALINWYWTGGIVKFITARPKPVHEATISWLLSWGLMMGPDALEKNVMFTEKGPHDSGQERIEYIRSVQKQTGLRVLFIEDRRETCEEVLQALGDHVSVLLTSRPWNVIPADGTTPLTNLKHLRRMTDEQVAAIISVV